MANRKQLRASRAALAGILGLALTAGSPAAAGHLVGVNEGALYTVELSAPQPVVHGPFLAATLNPVVALEMLRDEPAVLVMTLSQLHRVELGNPLAPVLAGSLTPPFPPRALISGGPRGFSLLLGSAGQLSVVDNATLAIRQTFSTPTARSGGALSPDGRTLYTFGFFGGLYTNYLSSFDPALGIGPESILASSFTGSERWGFFSPDGKTLGVVVNKLWFFTLGPQSYNPVLDLFAVQSPGEATPGEIHFMGSDMIRSHTFSRDGRELFFAQGALLDPVVADHNKFLSFALAGPGDVTPELLVPLNVAGEGSGSIARSAGGRRVFVAAARRDAAIGPAIPELYVYDPAAVSFETFELSRELSFLHAFETLPAVFADGFESGNSAAWDGEFP